MLFFVVAISVLAQSLPRSTPEAEGVSSAAIIQFIDSYQKEKHELHSVMIIRHGKVIAEGWWKPYAAELKHSMYSVSKSWTSTAVGFAVDEKRISLTDKVISFFPEDSAYFSRPFIADLTIRDLLTMSVGHEKEQFEQVFMQMDWSKGFLSLPIKYKPGSSFLYNTLATYMLSAIVQKVTNQPLIEYLEPRLFQPLGISGIDWEKNYAGVNTGGWGIRVKTEDMAKLGLLYLNKGMYNGKQILSADWVRQASSKQIEQNPAAAQSKKDSSDWLQGYGFQFWRCRNNAFRADGAFGQYIVMMPEQDAVVVITSESQDLQDDLNMIWQHLLPAFKESALPGNAKQLRLLKQKTNRLSLDPPVSSIKKGEEQFFNKKFILSNNPFGFAKMSIQQHKKKLSLLIETKDKKLHLLPAAYQQWRFAETDLVGPYLLRMAPVKFEQIAPFKTAGSYRWLNEETLELTIRYIESPHHWTITMKEENGELKINVFNSFSPKAAVEISGKE